MPDSSTSPAPPSELVLPGQEVQLSRSPVVPWSIWLSLGLFSILWLDLIRLLSSQWDAREQYAYGWFVPIFALALFWRRWLDRDGTLGLRDSRTLGLKDSGTQGLWDPEPGTQSPRVPESQGPRDPESQSPRVPGSQGPLVPWSLGPLLAIILLLPLRVIYEINRDWPLISWIYTAIVVIITLRALHLAGGRSWVKHFAFPVALILVAVVWPYRIEKGLTQGLMRVVAKLTVELLMWFDIPAMQRGNLIDLGNYTVGIDEACSGIRSFQSTLMAALVMGELYRMRTWLRLGLVGIGLSLAFAFNVVRTLLLSWQASQNGLEVLHKWHDPAGFTITVACFFVLWAVAVLVSRTLGLRDSGTQGLRDLGTLGLKDPESQSPRVPESQSPRVLESLSPKAYLTIIGIWTILALAATELWYRAHANPNAGIFYWRAALPENKPGFEKVELAKRSLALLHYDDGASGRWSENGIEWTAHFFRWNPRAIESVIYSRIHRPDVCLPGSGFKQVADSELEIFTAGDLKLPFRKYTYESEGHVLYVFFCQWEDGTERQAGLGASGQEDRLASVLKGRRLVGQQTFELILTGPSTLEEAARAVRQELPALIKRETLGLWDSRTLGLWDLRTLGLKDSGTQGP